MLPLRLRHVRGHVGSDEAGRDGVDRDAERTDLARERSREADKGRLRRGIDGKPAEPGGADDRTDVDDPTAAASGSLIRRTTAITQ
jgi:hypothetical protein